MFIYIQYLLFTVSVYCQLGDYTNKSIECKQGTFQNYHLIRDHYHKSFSCRCCLMCSLNLEFPMLLGHALACAMQICCHIPLISVKASRPSPH